MMIVGLTGSIGMGKTAAAAAFRRLGLPVHDADAAVHDLMGPGGAAVGPIMAVFPDVQDAKGGIDRRALGDVVFSSPEKLKQLEAVLHPLVRKTENHFLQNCARRRCPAVVLDIPLLLETHGDERCDVVVVVSAPARVQAARVLKRPGMTKEKFANILSKQMPDAEKRLLADVVVETGLGKNNSLRTISDIVTVVSNRRSEKWPRFPDRRHQTGHQHA